MAKQVRKAASVQAKNGASVAVLPPISGDDILNGKVPGVDPEPALPTTPAAERNGMHDVQAALSGQHQQDARPSELDGWELVSRAEKNGIEQLERTKQVAGGSLVRISQYRVHPMTGRVPLSDALAFVPGGGE